MRTDCSGFSLVELIVSLIVSVIIVGAGVAVFSGAMSTRTRESGRTDAITSAQAALSVMSREIGNAGYGLEDNGLITTDCTVDKLHFRANIVNTGDGSRDTITEKGEDVMYYFDNASNSVVRYDAITGETSGIINRVSDVDFVFHNYALDGTVTTGAANATTGRVTITLKIFLPDVVGKPSGRIEQVTSDITLRNSPYMLGQY